MLKKYFLILFLAITTLFSSEALIKESYLKSYDYEQMGKYTEAIKVLAPIYKVYPQGYTLNLRIGWLYSLNKNYNSSLKYYQKAHKVNLNSIEPKLGIIKVLLLTKSFEKAESLCNEIMKVDYYNYYANLYSVQSLINENKLDIASKILNKMLVIYPTNIPLLEQLSIIYKKNNNPLLNQLYKDILILDPNNVLVRTNI